MSRNNGRNGRKRLTWLLVALCLLLAVALSAPRLLQGLRGDQFRLNPNAKMQEDETYSLTFWVERPNLPDTAAWQQGLEQALTEFSLLHPNVQVTLSHLAPDSVNERMNSALAAGTPPDLFFSANTPPAGLGELQLPLARFVDKNERLAWSDALWNQLLSADGQVYSLPVAAYPRVFMVNASLLPEAEPSVEQIRQNGWAWSDLIRLAEGATDGQVKGFVPTSTGEALLQNMAASLGKPSPYDQNGNLVWAREDLVTLAETWLRLEHSGGAATKGSGMDANCLTLYLSEKAAIIGPVNHRLAAWLWQKAADKGIQSSLVPVPSVGATGSADVSVLGLSLLRQEPYQGDRHTRAGAELAQFLAPKLGNLLSNLTGALPATSGGEQAECIPFDQASFAVYANVSRAPASAYNYGPPLGSAETHWQLAISPAWSKLVEADYTAEQFAEAVLNELAMAAIAGP